MSPRLQEVFWYTAGSGVAFAADFTLLALLTQHFNWSAVMAATLSFSVGILIVYAFSTRLAFKHHRITDRRIEFSTFAAIGMVGIGINVGIIYICTHFWGMSVLLAKCVAALFTFSFNFIARRQALFVPRLVPQGPLA